MRSTKVDTLTVPGATLYYEVRGSGPVLVFICGGVYDAAGYAALAQHLADRYTVITYDRRGNSRSPLDGPPEPQSIEVHGDDAHRVIAEVGGPAYVFGNSSGAIIGLELAVRHPDQVRIVVAHEPPLFEMLSDRDHWRAAMTDVEETFARHGAAAAGLVLGTAFSGGAPSDPSGETSGADELGERIPGGGSMPSEPDPETMQMMARIEKNMEFFVGYEVPPFSRYLPDFDALLHSSTRVVAAIGDASGEHQPYYRAALAVAERLGTKPAVLPGDHGGFGAQPEAFAAKLHELLIEADSTS